MPLTARSSTRRRRKNPNEKLPARAGDSASAQVMLPTRMKLRVRRRDNTGASSTSERPEDEGRSQGGGGRSSRRKNTRTTSSAASEAPTSTPPSSSASARAALASEEASPDSKCPICLDRFNNLAYLDRCLHRFCFPCIQEWSHNKAECPLCKQPFASILHSVRAEDDFKEYTLRPAPANSSVAATVAMVAAMASAARSDHQMRLMLRRHRAIDGGETTTRRQRRERRGRDGGGSGRSVEEGAGVWEWYLHSPRLPLPPVPHHPAVSPAMARDSEEGEDLAEPRMRGGADLADRGVMFEGLVGLEGAPVFPNDRATRRLMTRLAARRRLQREGGTVRSLRERETVAFRRALYRSGIRVRGVAGVTGTHQQNDVTAETFHRNPAQLNRLRPWLQRELTVLYGAHDSLVDIVQRIIMARLSRHGLEDTPFTEEELRPFLLARTDHFMHELVSFARSPLSLENYDLQAVYEPPDTAMELGGSSSSSDSSSVIAISEGEEEEERRARGRAQLGRAEGANDDIIHTGSCLNLSVWDDETPGPSYSTAEPSCSVAPLPFSPAPQEAANEGGGEKEEEGEEECLIVGYKKPIAERTPELVQLSSDTEEEEEQQKKEEQDTEEKTPPFSSLAIIPPSTSGACQQEASLKEKEVEPTGRRSQAASCSGRSRDSVCSLSPVLLERERDRKSPSGNPAREKRRRRKRQRRGRDKSCDRLRKRGTFHNPNRSIYPAMMRRRSHSPSPFHSSSESGSPLPSPLDPHWQYCSQVSPLTSSISSPSSSPICSSPQLSSPPPQTPPTPPSLSSGDGNARHSEKPSGKRKYKSRHLDHNKDPSWRPGGSRRRERRRERRGRGNVESSRKCRAERSPSVEIIYEGTVTSDPAQHPARKRRRGRYRKTQHNSSPVIITLDSDSSHDSAASSSSPLSSQQTIDFSDLPPLPSVHSAIVGGAMDTDIGELPVDILDRGSDESETERRYKPADPVAIDNSDHDVDMENDSGSLLGRRTDATEPLLDAQGPIGEAESKSSDQTAASANGSARGGPQNASDEKNSAALTSDTSLLATILSDLEGMTPPTSDPSSNFEPSCSSGTRKATSTGQCEVTLDEWSVKTPPCHTSFPPPLKVMWDAPPLFKQAAPLQSYYRNIPPPLKHKHAGSLLPGDGPHLNPTPSQGDPFIPPVSVLRLPFTGERASTSSPSPAHLTTCEPTSSCGLHSSLPKASLCGAARSPCLDDSSPLSRSVRASSQEAPPSVVNSCCPPAHTHSTSRGHRTPSDLESTGSLSADLTPASLSSTDARTQTLPSPLHSARNAPPREKLSEGLFPLRLLPPVDQLSSTDSGLTDRHDVPSFPASVHRHLNHVSPPPDSGPALQSSQRGCELDSDHLVPPSKHQTVFEATRSSPFPADSRHTDNHIPSSSRPLENQWRSAGDARTSANDRGGVWTAHIRHAPDVKRDVES
ncbi:uncharacterized protein ACBR49_019266 [Aulostomus maculatus]